MIRPDPYLFALVDRSLEVLLMLALLSRFLGVLISRVDDEKEDEELVLARESSSDIPILWATGRIGRRGEIGMRRDRHGEDMTWRLEKEDCSLAL